MYTKYTSLVGDVKRGVRVSFDQGRQRKADASSELETVRHHPRYC